MYATLKENFVQVIDPEKTYWYRYENKVYAPPVDEFDRVCGEGLMKVILYRWEVVKHTPKGVWLELWGQKRFVLNRSRRRFACPTKDEARVSFIARKTRQAGIYEARARTARQAVAVFSPSAEELELCV